jgi:hypothetical protein
VEFHFSRRRRGGIIRSFSDERMAHLSKNGLGLVETNGAIRRLSLGSRTERLRREFRENFVQRATKELKIERAARRKVKADTTTAS